MRLFMSYLATHPEKLDPTKKQQWAKLARLDAQDMDTVCNLAYLNVSVMKQPGSQVCVLCVVVRPDWRQRRWLVGMGSQARVLKPFKSKPAVCKC